MSKFPEVYSLIYNFSEAGVEMQQETSGQKGAKLRSCVCRTKHHGRIKNYLVASCLLKLSMYLMIYDLFNSFYFLGKFFHGLVNWAEEARSRKYISKDKL